MLCFVFIVFFRQPENIFPSVSGCLKEFLRCRYIDLRYPKIIFNAANAC
ncbi:MAG: hypothetical protein IKH45_07215 [Neisseriaceae bacterium]|nr:hypothetical protein [Neisseriaceae bacterium]